MQRVNRLNAVFGKQKVIFKGVLNPWFCINQSRGKRIDVITFNYLLEYWESHSKFGLASRCLSSLCCLLFFWTIIHKLKLFIKISNANLCNPPAVFKGSDVSWQYGTSKAVPMSFFVSANQNMQGFLQINHSGPFYRHVKLMSVQWL